MGRPRIESTPPKAPSKSPDPKKLLPLTDAAEMLPWATEPSLRHLEKEAKRWGLVGVFLRLGGRVLVNVEALEDYFAAQVEEQAKSWKS